MLFHHLLTQDAVNPSPFAPSWFQIRWKRATPWWSSDVSATTSGSMTRTARAIRSRTAEGKSPPAGPVSARRITATGRMELRVRGWAIPEPRSSLLTRFTKMAQMVTPAVKLPATSLQQAAFSSPSYNYWLGVRSWETDFDVTNDQS